MEFMKFLYTFNSVFSNTTKSLNAFVYKYHRILAMMRMKSYG